MLWSMISFANFRPEDAFLRNFSKVSCHIKVNGEQRTNMHSNESLTRLTIQYRHMHLLEVTSTIELEKLYFLHKRIQFSDAFLNEMNYL